MVTPSKLIPPGEPEKTERTGGAPGQPAKESTEAKTTAASTDDGSKKPFKEYLDVAPEKQIKQPSKVSFMPDDDDDDVRLSLLDLAANAKIREAKGKPSVVDTALFHQEPVDHVEGGPLVGMYDEDSDALKTGTYVTSSPQESKSLLESVSKDVVKDVAKDVVKDAPKDTLHATAKGPVKEFDESVAKSAVKDELKPLVADKKPDSPAHIATVAAKTDDSMATKKSEDETKITEKTEVKVADKTEAKVVFHEAIGQKVDTSNVVVAASPQAVHAASVVTAAKEASKTSNVREVMLKLAQAMVEEIQQIKKPDQTETTFTLKHPPIFEGIEVKITEYNTSQKQFNVTFSDVNNPTARALIEQQDNQVRLQQALLERGYTMQMVTVEQKIPGLASTETGETKLGGRNYEEGGQAGSATDHDEGNVT